MRVQAELDTVRMELEEERTKKPTRGDDWAIVEEVEKVFKVNLEALKITREELDRGQDS
jgi:hypothetical protein